MKGYPPRGKGEGIQQGEMVRLGEGIHQSERVRLGEGYPPRLKGGVMGVHQGERVRLDETVSTNT